MGNYKLRLSDMIPNAWFYKLKDTGAKGSRYTADNSLKKKKPPKPKEPSPSPSPPTPTPTTTYPRKSHYLSRELPRNDSLNLPDPPRRSSKHRTSRRTTSPKRVFSSVSAGCSFRAKTVGNSPTESDPLLSPDEAEVADSLVFRPELIRSDRLLVTHSFDQTLSCNKIESDSSNDIVKPPLSEMDLPPIVTTKQDEKKLPRIVKQRTKSAWTNNYSSTQSPGIRLRINSPRIASRRSLHQVQGRKSLSLSLSMTSGSSRSSSSSSSSSSARSLAVVKSSVDPQRDFRESMVEMIVENNLRGSKDLEDLLACYLSLNADVYHDIIIKVFKQIWFDLSRATLNKPM